MIRGLSVVNFLGDSFESIESKKFGKLIMARQSFEGGSRQKVSEIEL